MPIRVKSIAEVAKKWGEITPGRSAYYEAGASNAGDEWLKQTLAAAASFKAALSAANIQQLFAGGVARAGAAKFNRKVKEVGIARFGQGVAAGVPDYAAGEAPMLEALAGVELGPRAPRGSAINYARVEKVGVALNRKRLALRAAGG